MKYESTRLLAILSYNTACQLANNSKSEYQRKFFPKQTQHQNRFARESDPIYYRYRVFCRQAMLWNIVTCLAKGVRGDIHAPKSERGELLKLAKAKWQELQDWSINHSEETKKLIAPLIAEYEIRDKKRKECISLKEAEKCIA